MRQRIWRRLFAAAACVIAAAGAAPAQPAGLPPVIAQPAPGATAPTVAAPAAPVVVQGNGGCAGCGSGIGGGVAGHHSAGGGYFMPGPGLTPTRLGSGVNGCGSFRQDLSFVFGPCSSFFAPCGGLSAGCGGKHGLGGKHTTPVYGTGGRPFNPCCYDSYANH